ncbi:MAG: CBS domain-containing protein [Pirellulaceae bacterium]|nr:CBS domain-containing protein [Pirellulaceae bacterium]
MDFRLNLKSETVEQLDSIPPLCVTTDTAVRDVFRQLKERRRGAVMVCREGVLVGLFTERDALKMMAAGDDLDVPVESVMTRDPVTAAYQDSIQEAITRMSNGGYRRLPIVDDGGRPVGVLSVRHVLRFLVEHFPQTIYTLPPTPKLGTKDREGA